ncbi:MAG: acryloyl-CoA reductase [Gammaproteobacteria bacterium]|nr:MAG: acryloyl-CoA reductase [Gammaproteobacteria bacterium]
MSNDQQFKALVIEETDDGDFTRSIQQRPIDSLPEGELLVRVHYSSLNYKDALSASGNKGVTRNFPHTPGIDAAGVVEESDSDEFKPGDQVIVTSYDLGMNTSGGFGQYIRVPTQWAVPLPSGISLQESMALGTAGFTAAMSVYELASNTKPEQGPVLVTGATGGVGSIAVSILSKLGYSVTAVTGKKESEVFLQKLGAADIVSRDTVMDSSNRPILKGQWAGVIDTVGGEILASAIKSTKPLGAVTCCGNVASPDLQLTVFPFILRGVRLIGIDSQNCPMPHRREIWELLARDWKLDQLDLLSREIGLDELDENIDKILAGKQQGRVVITLQ